MVTILFISFAEVPVPCFSEHYSCKNCFSSTGFELKGGKMSVVVVTLSGNHCFFKNKLTNKIS